MGSVDSTNGKWDRMLPGHGWRERRDALRALFEGIAPSYDRLNRWLSLGIDRSWRRRAAREVFADGGATWVLDLASGTGDQAVEVLRRGSARVVRLDLSVLLLDRAAGKLPAGGATPATAAPAVVAEMEALPIRAESVDAVTMAFALRHVESLEALMRACFAVLRPGGKVVFVDMSIPERGAAAALYRFYFRACLPRLAVLFGGERLAYELMVRSVESFPGWDRLAAAGRDAGFDEVSVIPLTRGAATIFLARKPKVVV